jgi:hypothetical protein
MISPENIPRIFARWANDEVGPIMHHGVKDPKDVTSFYYKDCCHLSRQTLVQNRGFWEDSAINYQCLLGFNYQGRADIIAKL